MAERITDEELQQTVEAIQRHEERRAQLEELIEKSEGGETKYLSLDRQSWKKSPSVWSFRDYLCEACGKIFTQSSTLNTHQRYHCKNLQTQKMPKDQCPNCSKLLHRTTVYKHVKKGCPKRRVRQLEKT